jgi:hypothetical protein
MIFNAILKTDIVHCFGTSAVVQDCLTGCGKYSTSVAVSGGMGDRQPFGFRRHYSSRMTAALRSPTTAESWLPLSVGGSIPSCHSSDAR